MFKPPKPANMDLNLAPMVDVMMCLIIFFLLASKLVSAENYELNLPWAQGAKQVDKSALGQRVTINVMRPSDADAAEYIVVEWDPQTHEIRQTPRSIAFIEQLLLARAARARQDDQELRCVIRADENARYADVEAVLRAAGLAKIGKIVFGVNEGENPEDGA